MPHPAPVSEAIRSAALLGAEDGAGEALARIAAALERLAPPPPPAADLHAAPGYLWEPAAGGLLPVARIAHVALPLLQGVDGARDTLLRNTRQFAEGRGANNALLWGARGMGKSSLVKAVHAQVSAETGGALALVEIHREDLPSLAQLMRLLQAAERRFLLLCDDLSFEAEEAGYKSLKAVLDGGIEGRPENVLFYATSNRRHLLPRNMMENEASTALHPGEAVEEKVSLSDRFGLWLGFHPCSQPVYLQMVEGYVAALGLAVDPERLRREAIAWAAGRGSRSGRVAWQFIQDLAGKS